MYLNEWMKKWLVAMLVCLLLIAGCVTYMLVNNGAKDGEVDEPPLVINQVRVKVNDLLLYIERNYRNLEHDSNVYDTLQKMSVHQKVDLLFSKLDGRVIFNSSKDDSVPYLDLKHDLHYDLYASKVEGNMFKIAFPVVDKETQTQVGNAIFTIDKNNVQNVSQPSNHSLILFFISLLSIFLLGLLCMVIYKCKTDIIQPIKKLKKSTEDILKGKYEQSTEYVKNDEIGELYAVFEQMRIEIMELSIQRDEQEKSQKKLISSISHDIKTPLTTLKAYLDAIYEGICPNMESIMEYVKIMQTNTEKMSRLIDDLFIHSLKALGHIPVHPKEQYSRAVLSSIIYPIGHYVRTIGIIFMEPAEIPNVLIKVDEHRLEQVISNLVTNSLKHTSPGGSISILADIDGQMLKIQISDTGEGILPQDMPFIFERYFRGNKNADQSIIKNEGSGLGLSICKHIMEAHDGSIQFKSKKKEGTVFTLLLPIS